MSQHSFLAVEHTKKNGCLLTQIEETWEAKDCADVCLRVCRSTRRIQRELYRSNLNDCHSGSVHSIPNIASTVFYPSFVIISRSKIHGEKGDDV